LGEWGLRFWVVLVARLSPPGSDSLVEWTYDPLSGELVAASGATEVVIRGERPPLPVTFHDSLGSLRQEFETKGYFYLDSRGERGRVAALRYHLEEMPSFRFAAPMAHDRRLASVH